MATIEKRFVFELTPDEKTWLSFANLALAQICEQLDNEEIEYVMNSETGEIMEIKDFKRAFQIFDYLLDGNMELKY